MKSKIDIDTLLDQDSLELVLGGKTYLVRDVPVSVFASTLAEGAAVSDPEALRGKLATILGIGTEELKQIGFKAIVVAIQEVSNWMMNQDFLKGGGGKGNP